MDNKKTPKDIYYDLCDKYIETMDRGDIVEMAMIEYAEQQVKNLNIPTVIGDLTCDSCGSHPNVIYTNSTGRFCERCKPANGLLTLKFD